MTIDASCIRDIKDYPKPGIVFKDITTLLKDPSKFRESCDEMLAPYTNKKIDIIAGIESRGFIFGAAMAYSINASFVPIRKAGKLPYNTIKESYALEYGEDSIEIHEDSIKEGQNILIVDDLLATGGTIGASINLIERLKGNIVGISFLIELSFLNGREKLKNYAVNSLISYDSE